MFFFIPEERVATQPPTVLNSKESGSWPVVKPLSLSWKDSVKSGGRGKEVCTVHHTSPGLLSHHTHSVLFHSFYCITPTLILTLHFPPHTAQVHMYLLLHILSDHPRLHLHCQVAGIHMKNLVLVHNTTHSHIVHSIHIQMSTRPKI